MQVSCDSVQMVFPHRLESLESRDPFNAWREWKVSDLHASNSERTPKSTSKTSIQHARVPESRQHPSAHSELTACQHAVWNVTGLTRHHPPGDRAELLFIHQLGTGRTAAHTSMVNLASEAKTSSSSSPSDSKPRNKITGSSSEGPCFPRLHSGRCH